MEFLPPLIALTIQYDFYGIAYDAFFEKDRAIQGDLKYLYSLIATDVNEHIIRAREITMNSVPPYTPVSSGALRNSLQIFRGKYEPGPIESLTWSARTYELLPNGFPDTSKPLGWEQYQETALPRYYEVTIVCYSSMRMYVLPVELGSQPHVAPIARLAEWVLRAWSSSDPSDVYRLRSAISKRGTPRRDMFYEGFNASVIPISFLEYTEGYAVVPVLVRNFTIPLHGYYGGLALELDVTPYPGHFSLV